MDNAKISRGVEARGPRGANIPPRTGRRSRNLLESVHMSLDRIGEDGSLTHILHHFESHPLRIDLFDVHAMQILASQKPEQFTDGTT